MLIKVKCVKISDKGICADDLKRKELDVIINIDQVCYISPISTFFTLSGKIEGEFLK